MIRPCFRLSMLASLMLAAALAAQAPKTNQKPPADTRKDAETKLLKAGTVTGELIQVDAEKKGIRIKVSITYAEPNQGAIQGLANAQRALADAQRRRDIQAIQNASRDIANHQRNLYTVKTEARELTFEAAEECPVRLSSPKEEFDDMGNPKKLTRKEIEEKRDKKDRLFPGEFSDLQPGQWVSVTLVRKKPVKPMKKEETLDENRPKMSKIVILASTPKK